MESQLPARTKCIATLGPASSSDEVIAKLMQAGVYMLRNNFSHMSHDEYRQRHETVKRLNRELGTSTLMQVDVQGPHIRIGKVAEEGVFLKERHTYYFSTLAGEPQPYDIPVNDATIQGYIKVGQPISFLNGLIEGEITTVEGHRFGVRMINSGTVKSNKSINFPETQLDSCLTEKDRQDIAFLREEGVDWLALSFVSKAEEVNEARALLNNPAIKLMSKIERKSGVQNMDGIIRASDGIMVARGDLGIELPMEDVPFIQKDIITLGHHAGKPVVVATQMMYSMIHSSRPTRAEVADVAEAVCEHADAVMLSDETTEGIDPVNTVKTMLSIVRRAESYLYGQPNFFEKAA